MIKIDIKPLSVNDAWKGSRYKSNKYLKYQRDLRYLLPKIELPDPPYIVYYEFGFSSKGSDIDNPVKPLQDILSKKYGFNDNLIYRIVIDRVNVKKGEEYLKFKIESYD